MSPYFFKFFAMRAIPSVDSIAADDARGSVDEVYFPGQTGLIADLARRRMEREREEMTRRNWKGNDKYHHCKANCEATRLGPVGLAVAILGSLYREVRQGVPDIVQGNYKPGDAAEDMKANEQGRRGALEQPNKSCQDICANLAPPGYLGD